MSTKIENEVSIGGRKHNGFLPPQLAGLTLWLRADSNITLNGSNVSAQGDKSGSSHDFTQGTAGKQPAWLTNDNDIGGQASITYDDIDDGLISDEAASIWSFMHNGSGVTVCIMCRPSGVGIFFDTLRALGTRVGFELRWGLVANTFTWLLGNVTGTLVINRNHATAITAGTKAVISARMKTGVNASMRVNRVDESFALVGTPSAADPFGTLALGEQTAGSGDNFGGEIPEVIVYNRYITTSETQQVESYLSARYSIA